MTTTKTKPAKIAVKKLKKPIKTVIDIQVKTWFDKYYGNSYHSARVTINNDYINQLVIPYQCGNFDKSDVLKQLPDLYQLKIAKYTCYDGTVVKGSIVQDESILVIEHLEAVPKVRCKSFGEKS
jgi:hypothetical protein